jgi:ribonuclease P protein component
MNAPQTYRKSERLKSRKRIELLFKEGKRISIAPLLFIYRIHPESGIRNPQSPIIHPESGIRNPQSPIIHPESGIPEAGISLRSIQYPESSIREAAGPKLQAGVGVRSRQFKHAVDRNRIKRLLRECWRTQKNELRAKVAAGTNNLDVFILYTGTELPSLEALSDKTDEGIRKMLERLSADQGRHLENNGAI